MSPVTKTTRTRTAGGGGIRRAATGLLVLTAMLAGPARAQAPAEPAKGKDAKANTHALPEMGEVLSAIDQATKPDEAEKGAGWSPAVRLAVVFAALAILPSLLIMMTSFTRIVIVLSFVRRALTTQSIPPNVAVIGLALFLTIFTMSDTIGEIHETAVKPYTAKEITFEQSVDRSAAILKDFMLRHTRRGDLKLFLELADAEPPKTQADVPTHVAIPAFAISEFRTAFEMGCLLFIPFLLVDLVVAGILLSAGMMMLPPAIISLPFKIILFVLVDGWGLLARQLVASFQ